ncbi:MAG: helix-turn-helix domain-containing protein [Pseudopelagicola sp.]|nr:helix-turn-helix domain-containing protein [Pseudopelagicola sp.]
MSHKYEKQMLNVEEVATLLGLGVSTVWAHAKAGKLPAPIKIGRASRWRKADIEGIYQGDAA